MAKMKPQAIKFDHIDKRRIELARVRLAGSAITARTILVSRGSDGVHLGAA